MQSAGKLLNGSAAVAKKQNSQSGDYLPGCPHDVGYVQNYFFMRQLCSQSDMSSENYSHDCAVTPENRIKGFFSRNIGKNVVIYYTGHGTEDGDWCFSFYEKHQEVYVSPQQVTQWYKEANQGENFLSLSIISDSCYSGKWCQEAERNPDIFTFVLTSATPYECCYEGDCGGRNTLRWFVRDDNEELLSTPCIYSWNRDVTANRFWRVFRRSFQCSHGMRLFQTPDEVFICDKCEKMFPQDTTMYGCRACDYDLCQPCSQH